MGGALKQDQHAALDLLVGERRKFLNFVRASVRDTEAAEEILQRASVKVIARGDSLRDPARAEAWIFRVLRNEMSDYYRRLAAQSKREEALPEEISPETSSPNTGAPSRTCPCVNDEIGKLRANYADAIRAVEMNGEAVIGYASRKGLSANNAMVLLHRARKALRQRLQSRCAHCAGAGCFDCTCEA